MFYHSSYHAPANGRAQNQDLINATNQRYTHLRDEARHEGDEAHKSVSLDSHTPLSDTTWNDLIASVHQVFCAISPGLPVRPCPTSLVDALLWKQSCGNKADHFRNGDRARAHELSEQGKAHERRHDELNNEASGWIFNGK